MIPQAASAALGIAVNLISDLAPEIKVLRQAYATVLGKGPKAGVYSRFVGKMFANNSGMTVADARTLYHAAKYYYDQSHVLGVLPDDQLIDRRLAVPITSLPYDLEADQFYRYGVKFQVVYPGETTPREFIRWFRSDRLLSPNDIKDIAAYELFATFNEWSAPSEWGGTVSGVKYNATITDFGRFVRP